MSSAASALATKQRSNGDNYPKRKTGFLMVGYKEVYYNLPRLTSGKTQILCLLHVLSETISASRPGGTPAPKESRPMSTAEFQWYTGDKSLSAVQHALQDLCERKLISRQEAKESDFSQRNVPAALRGWYIYSVTTVNWDKLRAVEKVVQFPGAEESTEDETEDSAEEETGTPTYEHQLHLISGEPTGQPLHLKPGRPSKVFKPPVPIAGVQIQADHGVEIDPIIGRTGTLQVWIRMSAELRALIAEANNRRNQRAAQSTSKNGSDANNGFSGSQARSFGTFLELGRRAGLPGSQVDWDEAGDEWRGLPITDRIAALKGLEDRIACGEFAVAEYRPRPDKYLKKRTWERPLRASKAANQQDVQGKIDSAVRRLSNLRRS